MFQGIIGITLFIIAVTFCASFHSAGTPRNNILLGVKLRDGVLKGQEIMEIAKRYKKGNRSIFFVFIVLALALFKLQYTSLILIYMSVWCVAYYYVGSKHYQYYFEKLLLMKSKNRWFPTDSEYHELTSNDNQSDQSKRLLRLYRQLFPDRREILLKKAAGPIYVDEDEYWINGYYDNPLDKRKSVQKRFGFGTTANMAYKKNRLISYGAIVFMIVLVGGIAALFVRMDFTTFRMTISDRVISIDAPVYDYQFKTEDIIDVSITEVLSEQGWRTNGAATSTYYLGNFNFDEYGSSKVFLYFKHPPYIVIRLKDKTVLFNTKSEEDTTEYYRQLVYLIEGREEKTKNINKCYIN